MDNFTAFLEAKIVPVADKLAQNKSLQSVQAGFMLILPITILGAIFTLLGSFQVDAYQSFIAATGLKTVFGFIPSVTTGMLAVYGTFAISKSLTEKLGYEKQAAAVGVITVAIFFMMIPFGVSGTSAAGDVVTIAGAIGTRNLGAIGLFSGIIFALIAPRIYTAVIKAGWTFKMPEGVPPMVTDSFSSLIPAFITIIVFAALRYGISFTSYGDINSMIYAWFQTPLRSLAASPFTFMLFLFLVSLFWFFGIHGGLVVMPILNTMYLPLALENLAALDAGQTLPHIITQTDWFVFGMIGGGGATIGLALFYAFFAKSERYKTLGRIALPASLVGINEPITFGSPVVMNPILMIPFFLTPLTVWTISYVLRVVGFLPYLNGTNIPTGTPLVFSAFITGGWLTALVQVGLIAVSFFMYFPFAKLLDNKALAEENNQ